MRRTDADAATVADVRALGSFPHDHKVNLARVREWRGDSREHDRRPQVHIVVEGEAKPEQEATLNDAAGEARVARVPANRSEEDCIVRGEGCEVVIAEDLAGREKVTCT